MSVYCQGGGTLSSDELKSYHEFQERNRGRPPEVTVPKDSYQQQTLEVAVDTDEMTGTQALSSSDVQPALMPGIKQNKFTEKTNLLNV